MGDTYSMVWISVFAMLDEKTSYGQISRLSGVSKSQTYRVIQWGINQLKDMGVSIDIYTNDKDITITIGKAKTITVHNNNTTKQKVTYNNQEDVQKIIAYLNEKTNRKYTTKAKDALRAINARIKEGYTVDDFKKVIDIKSQKWMNTDMEDYLRPITLFGTKFNSYINERATKESNQSTISKTLNTASKVAEELGFDSEDGY